MSVILEIENISKKFKIYHNKQPYLSLRDTIVDAIKHPSKVFQTETEEFWALKDVSFTVNEGESIGIIGKNGAGKSTLLKILSRITPPTKGKITLRGRVASLLEVGTGFHPELTGRENVYFNGAILGMKRSEIKRKFDEIVAFAGVEKFIDTPLKHYSSGMQLRLAFAVAAFLEAEILVVDEVLAVGDAEFQKKCLGKMEDVTKKEGRTVLFVSHNMGTIRSFCKKGLYLENGSTIGIEPVEQAISKYIQINQNIHRNIQEEKWNVEELKTKEAKILKVETLTATKQKQQTFNVDEEIIIRITYWTNTKQPVLVNFLLINEWGLKVMIGTDAGSDFYSKGKSTAGIYSTDFIIPAYLLNNTGYFIHAALDSPIHQTCYDVTMNAAFFQVNDPINESSHHRGIITKNFSDVAIWPKLKSKTQKIN